MVNPNEEQLGGLDGTYGCSSLLLVRPCNRQVDVQDPAPAASLPKGGVFRVVSEKRTGLISSAGGRQIPVRALHISLGALLP
jgi:hypothetical protein